MVLVLIGSYSGRYIVLEVFGVLDVVGLRVLAWTCLVGFATSGLGILGFRVSGLGFGI